jgi:hypothetical protein
MRKYPTGKEDEKMNKMQQKSMKKCMNVQNQKQPRSSRAGQEDLLLADLGENTH